MSSTHWVNINGLLQNNCSVLFLKWIVLLFL